MPKYITQTNRTILFEEFSHSDGSPTMKNHFKKDINETFLYVKNNLLVHNFNEFMDKFTPKYYECIKEDKSVIYTTNIDECNDAYTEHNLKDQPFYKTIMKIYNDKKSSGENNYEFDYSSLTETMFSPKRAMQDAKEIRDKLVSNYNEYCQLVEKDASPDEQEECASEVLRCRQQICEEYLSQSVLNILPLAIADLENRLNSETSVGPNGEINDTGSQPAVLAVTQNGPQTISAEIQPTAKEALPQHQVPLLTDMIGNDFDTAIENGKNQLVYSPRNDPEEQKIVSENNNFMRELIISIFVPNADSDPKTKLSPETMQKNLNAFKTLYRASQQSFCSSVVSLMEKVLNVKAFFDNAGGDAELIISNCRINKLMSLEKEKFEAFIKKMGSETGDERIWFAIVPGIFDKSVNYCEAAGNSMMGISINSSSAEPKTELVTLNEFKSAIELLGNSKIITFFNFKGDSRTSFKALNAAKVREYKKNLKSLDSLGKITDYAVFCYPNFEVLPLSKSSVEIGVDEYGHREYIKLPSVYIDSSYVAAALYVKSQNLDILKNAGFEIEPSLAQPVRFDFEIDFDTKKDKKVPLAQVFTTNFSGELILGWETEVKEEINKDGGFGFCFCNENMLVTYGGKTYEQDKIYVYRARTLGRDEEGENSGRTRPVFKTMIQTYIEIIAKKASSDQIDKCLQAFNSKNSVDYINNILYSPEKSSLKNKESITRKNNKIIIVYDIAPDSFELDFQEKTIDK